jgi:hypothetical protein
MQAFDRVKTHHFHILLSVTAQQQQNERELHARHEKLFLAHQNLFCNLRRYRLPIGEPVHNNGVSQGTSRAVVSLQHEMYGRFSPPSNPSGRNGPVFRAPVKAGMVLAQSRGCGKHVFDSGFQIEGTTRLGALGHVWFGCARLPCLIQHFR